MDWDLLDSLKFRDEAEVIAAHLAAPPLAPAEGLAVASDAESLVRTARRTARRQGVVESFLQEFSLGTREGLALMCLAEALLRTPSETTRDALIAEKIGSADWASHLGRSESLFVNASTWGLMLTGRLVDVDEEARRDIGGFLRSLAGRLGEPVIRTAVAQAVKIMGEQFVLGRTIDEALKRAAREGFMCSFDMLGEGARTEADADRYEAAYAQAIETVGRSARGAGPEAGHGISVKLSALSPRYESAHADRVFETLYPRLLRLARSAAALDLNLTLDAEEADRLVLSLRILDRLTREPSLGGWRGLGLAVQAYQTRAPAVIAAVADLARDSGRRLMVRLVKGAYWDSEIKRAQVGGLPAYPVFTTKAATDLSYLVAAKALIEAAPALYAQFATHNAHTLAAVRRMAAGRGVSIEHQRLHGMGEALYAAAQDAYGPLTLRAYAPVGGHEALLPYLVRRLLENGANSSFVHALLDEAVPAEIVAADPLRLVAAAPTANPRIPLPRDLYGDRENSMGADLSQAATRQALNAALAALDVEPLFGAPIIGGQPAAEGEAQPITSPADRRRQIGTWNEASAGAVDAAFTRAKAAQPVWNAMGGDARASRLRAAADAMEAAQDRLAALCVREAGKTWPDAIAEVREAVDFCRYYALLAKQDFAGPRMLKGPSGETNSLELHGRGVFACISPWNFPLAIFTGQVAAALAAGNAVVAKPAEQTPLIAAEAIRLLHAAGVPPDVLQFTPGRGDTVGAHLVRHPDLAGVAFTGGTQTAWAINRALAARQGPILPLIAETGGLNGMFVDGTALREQVIDDVLASAFGSAGQRCSALRLLFLPHETADMLIAGLIGAMDGLTVGDPANFATDVGPVIDADARQALEHHIAALLGQGRVLHRLRAPGVGDFVAPTLAEIPLSDLPDREVFGPVLHVVRYDADNPETAARALAARGYGLTLGVHSRLDGFARRIREWVPAGNVYVNRSQIGAVVGVQPFGGEGLSGTGPKAGGPHALLRYAVERAVSINIAAQGGDPELLNL